MPYLTAKLSLLLSLKMNGMEYFLLELFLWIPVTFPSTWEQLFSSCVIWFSSWDMLPLNSCFRSNISSIPCLPSCVSVYSLKLLFTKD